MELQTSPQQADQSQTSQQQIQSSQQEPQSKESQRSHDERLSSKFAAIAKREKELFQKEQEIQRKIEEAKKYDSIQKTIRENPLKFMEENGITYQQLTDLILNDGKKSPEDEIKGQFMSLKEEIEAIKRAKIEEEEARKRMEDEAKQAREQEESQAIERFKSQMTSLIKDAGEEFELINHLGVYEHVWSEIDKHHKETEQLMDVRAAAEIVEKRLESEFKNALQLKKIGSLLGTTVKEDPVLKPGADLFQAQVKDESKQLPYSVSLSNKNVSTPSVDTKRVLSKEESIKEAAKLIKWT